MRAKPEHIGKIHLVFDVENLSCMTNGHLLSFACVMFHADEGWMDHVSFTLLQERGKPRGHIDPDTVQWWIGQALQNPEAAMDTFNLFGKGDDKSWSIDDARAEFMHWVKENVRGCWDFEESDDIKQPVSLLWCWKALDLQVWGHAPRVDLIQLENTLWGGEGNGPWSFKAENDTRTLMNRWRRLHPGEGDMWKLADARARHRVSNAPHSAVRDAYRQAFMVILDHGWADRFPGPLVEPD